MWGSSGDASLIPKLGTTWRCGRPHVPSALPPGKDPDTHRIGGQMGPALRLDGFGQKNNFFLLPKFEPRTAKPAVIRRTDCAVPTTILFLFMEPRSSYSITRSPLT